MISRSVRDFLRDDPQALAERLAFEDVQRHRLNEAKQLHAWLRSVSVLQQSVADWPQALGWRVVLEFSILRLGKRIDAVLVTPAGVVVLEFKVDATGFDHAGKRQVEDYALDLQDFHSGSRRHPIVPVLVATEARARPPEWRLSLPFGVGPVLEASAASLAALLREVVAQLPAPETPLDVAGWERASYAPVPSIIDAACTLYDRHDVVEIATAGADRINLTRTTEAILAAVQDARSGHRKIAVFVTGVPGAGKTLCGLNAAFGVDRRDDATYLTGNPTLVHVLREALARDAAARGMQLAKARQNMEKAVQALPRFRDHHVATGHVPAERVIVVDEAQRAWSEHHARRKSKARAVQLEDSEAGHLLDAMDRHQDWAVVVCLIGGGQEIHDGEGGLAEWGRALAVRPDWRVLAAPGITEAEDPRQRLPKLAGLRQVAALHLSVPVRSLRNDRVAAWVDAVLRRDRDPAAAIAAQAPLPFVLTRELAAMRAWLRAAARGQRRAGLVASSGAKRLRAEGIGAELPHMDADAVAHWFLDRWPDVRAADALEVLGTEFSVQGLELDFVGLCWGGDLVLRQHWRARAFRGTAWQDVHAEEAVSNRLNTYRVLLTRARYRTVIWVPRGDAADATRRSAEMDAIAAFLAECGVAELEPAPAQPRSLQPALL